MAEVNMPDVPDKDHHLPQITQQGAKKQKQSVEKKLRNIFISDDADNVGDYLIWGVIVPAIQGMLQDAGHGIVDGIFGRRGSSGRSYDYHDYSRRRRRYDDEPSYRTSRRSDRERSKDRDRDYEYERRRSSKNNTEVLFNTRSDAEEVRDTLFEVIEKYGFASVSDINELCGFKDDYTDRKWGWRNLNRSSIRSTRDGYLLELPIPESLED